MISSSELILSVIVLITFIALIYTYQTQSTSPDVNLSVPASTINFTLFAIVMALALVYFPKYVPYSVTLATTPWGGIMSNVQYAVIVILLLILIDCCQKVVNQLSQQSQHPEIIG